MAKAARRDGGVMRKGRLPGTSEVVLTKDEAEVLGRLMEKQAGRRPRAATPVPVADPSVLLHKTR
ncbi:MAG: hypothetical protein ACRDJE_09760 [Dehalococcoidia bacterium]